MKNSIQNLIATVILALCLTTTTFAQSPPADSSNIVGTMIIIQDFQSNEAYKTSVQQQQTTWFERFYERISKAIYRGND